MYVKFTLPGGPGSKFKSTYEKMMKNLQLPKGAKEELGLGGTDENSRELSSDQ
jgi:hypothetical protein